MKGGRKEGREEGGKEGRREERKERKKTLFDLHSQDITEVIKFIT